MLLQTLDRNYTVVFVRRTSTYVSCILRKLLPGAAGLVYQAAATRSPSWGSYPMESSPDAHSLKFLEFQERLLECSREFERAQLMDCQNYQSGDAVELGVKFEVTPD